MLVRTRIAPSPTGDPHVGTAYVALFNYCFARANGGQFILRIEDTDTSRSNPHSEAMILRSLRWLGLAWEEGPDTGGRCGPYRQSERSEIYCKHAGELIEKGHAFRCFCTPERLAEMREKQRAAVQTIGYDGHCLELSEREVQSRTDAGEPFAIRMKVPREGNCLVKDLLRGDIVIDWKTVDLQVLLKPDGMPTYHLANVVDDHLMRISHVIRGEEWISSAPKHILLYQYFGWEMPVLCHLPLLRNPDKSKLSKRKNPTSLLFYERMGFLPEALLNYLGLMAWSLPSGEEKFSLGEMVAHFTLERISLGGPVFDLKKLEWLNGRWIRENLDEQEFVARVKRWALNEDYLLPVVPLVQSRISVLSDLGPLTQPFFSGNVQITADQLLRGKLDRDEVSIVLQLVLSRMDTIEWTKGEIENVLRLITAGMGAKLRDVVQPLFVAISGGPNWLPLFDGMAILGRDICRTRLRHALRLVGPPESPEKQKRLEALQEQIGRN